MPDPDREVTDATRAEERIEAGKHGEADRPATAEEAAAADENTLDPDVAKRYDEQNKRGAAVKGEGQITPG